MIQRLFLLALLILGVKSNRIWAQNKMSLGIAAEGIVKVYPLKYYKPLAAMQGSLVLRIENEQQNRLGLWLGLGFMVDPARYSLKSESTPASKVFIALTQRNLSFSGMIVFPTRSENVQLLAGIGMDYNLATDASYNWRVTNGVNTIHNGMGLDSIQILIDEKRRKFLPAASFGIQCSFPQLKRVKFYCIFRQNLLASFEEDIPIYNISTGKNEQPATNYKPSYLKLGLSCDFW